MLEFLLEAALRSFAFGCTVWLTLKLLRVQNPQIRMTAWTATLIACLATPALTHWHPASIPAPVAGGWPAWPFGIMDENPPAGKETSPPAAKAARSPQDAAELAALPEAAGTQERSFLKPVSIAALAIAGYIGGAGLMLARLLIGLALTWRLRRKARPVVDDWASGADVRLSGDIGSPVTFGSAILLPVQCLDWSPAKRLAVLAHERSHIAQGDFHVLTLATIHRAIFWFSPFSWWLLGELAKTAELVSDDAAIEAMGDRPSYAQILLDFAKCGRHIPAAIGMARTRTVYQRVERVLAPAAAYRRLGRTARLAIAASFVPLAAVTTASFAQQGNNPAGIAGTAAQADSPAGAFADYLGYYQPEASSTVLAVTAAGDRLFIQESGKPRLALNADSLMRFSNPAANAEVTFTRNWLGQVSELTLKDTAQGSRRAARVGDAEGKRIGDGFERQVSTTVAKFKAQLNPPETVEMLTRHIVGMKKEQPDYDDMTPALAEVVSKQPALAQVYELLGQFGEFERLQPRGVYFSGTEVRSVNFSGAEVYDVKFSKGSATWLALVNRDRKFEHLFFYPAGDATPGGVSACSGEAGLREEGNGAPIRMTFFNQSGAEAEVFALTAEGARQSQGRIEDNGVLMRVTSVATPWIVADSDGHCLEIVRPGRTTREIVITPAHSSGGNGKNSASEGERALRSYIARIQRNDPDLYKEKLTGMMWGLLHELLQQWGELREVSYKGPWAIAGGSYRLKFANGSTDVRMFLRKDGRIANMQVGPEG